MGSESVLFGKSRANPLVLSCCWTLEPDFWILGSIFKETLKRTMSQIKHEGSSRITRSPFDTTNHQSQSFSELPYPAAWVFAVVNGH